MPSHCTLACRAWMAPVAEGNNTKERGREGASRRRVVDKLGANAESSIVKTNGEGREAKQCEYRTGTPEK